MNENTSKDQCRVFISRKTSDRNVIGQKLRTELVKKASGRLSFFTADSLTPGETWRAEIRKELDKADILLLVLTRPATDEFDWCLYEAGLFEDLKGGSDKRIVCLFPKGAEAPKQLSERQGVEARTEKIVDFLVRLYTDPKFSNTVTPLNPTLDESDMKPFALTIRDRIDGKASDKEHLIHANKFIQVVLPEGVDSLGEKVEICSDRESLKDLFDLPRAPRTGDTWKWSDIVDKAELEDDRNGFNLKWTEELTEEVAARRGAHRASRQLNSRYLGKDGKLYRPEIEFFRENTNGTLTVDVTFSEQVQDSWLENARAPAALAANIALASRIRHQLLEWYLNKPESLSVKDTERDLQELERVKDGIEREGFVIRTLSAHSMGLAFRDHPDQARELGSIGAEFERDVQPALKKAIEERDPRAAGRALEAWKENNERFLRIGLQVYADLLGLDRNADCSRPLSAVGDGPSVAGSGVEPMAATG